MDDVVAQSQAPNHGLSGSASKILIRDVLSYAFELAVPPVPIRCCSVEQDEELAPSHSLNQAPMNVSQVCRAWRQLALSTPTLWTFIALRTQCHELTYLKFRSMMDSINLAKQWMLRSNSLPAVLSVYVWACGVEDDTGLWTDELLYGLRTFVHMYQGRWQETHLDFRLPDSGIVPPAVTMGYPTQLQRLEYQNDSYMENEDGEKGVSIDLSSMPCLAKLALDGWFILKCSGPSLFALQNVVIDTFPSADDCLLLLQYAPCLKTLKIHMVLGRLSATPPSLRFPELTHTNLQTLHLSYELAEETGLMLDKLTLPKLKHLRVAPSISEDNSQVVNTVEALLERSLAQLTSFEFVFQGEPEEVLLFCLSSLSGLTSLTLVDGQSADLRISNDTIRALTLNRDDAYYADIVSSLCPNLSVLRIIWDKDSAVDVEILADMVLSRRMLKDGSLEAPGRRSLTEFACGPPIYEKLRKIPKVRKCIAEGLVISDAEHDLAWV